MFERRFRGTAALRASLSAVLVCLLHTAGLGAQSWSTPLLSRDLVIVEKTRPGSGQPAGPLPQTLAEKLGPDFVEYESFVAVRLSPGPARSLMEAARVEGYGVLRETRRAVHLPFRDLDLGRPEAPPAGWEGSPLRPAPAPGMYVVRFSFPLQPDWTEALAGCVEGKPLYLGDGAFLVRATGLSSIRSCGIAAYLDWVGPYLGTDRIDRRELDRSGDDFQPWTLTYLPGTEEEEALAELPSAVRVLGLNRWDSDDTLSLTVLAGRPELEALLRTSGRLFAASPPGEPHLSDERQGLIVTGRHNGTQITPYPGAPGYTSYLTWLSNRGLRTASNQQTVAVFDTGYDDGTGPSGAHHPDLENPERLVDNANYVASPPTAVTTDAQGHGTMVAGVIAGSGTGSGTKDAQGFYLGTGIAPDAKLVAVQVFAKMGTDCTISSILNKSANPGLLKLRDAITFSRTNAAGGDKALIANHSWNSGVLNYDEHAKLMDERTVDGDPGRAGLQPMLMVVTAGNKGDLGDGSVENPGTAKNVITVGATQNYRPSLEASAPPNTCDPPAPAKYTTEADQIGQVSPFSARGKHFAALPDFQLVHNIRVKPDLVAPGGRIFSTVPYAATSTYVCQGICRDYWPDVLPPTDYHSYAQGTSFAAPVVSGMAALLRKQFLDALVNPSPSLIKANLIATSDDLNVAGDHRPSNVFGWGRANLDRATDTSVRRYYVTEDPALAVNTGQERTWTRIIDNPGRDTYVVLVWSDVASPASSPPGLINDLRLTVESIPGNAFWRGNNFSENISGTDNGYSYTYVVGGDPGVYDTVNTVEAIFILKNTFPPNQQIVIRVTGSSVQSGPQSFAFYAYNVR